MLVENAAKHNMMSKDHSLRIEVNADSQWIWVSNNKTTPPQNIISHNIGLENINMRYHILMNKGIEIINQEQFTVKIPIIT
jgi:LytS/YehU family sensor histidine kinase